MDRQTDRRMDERTDRRTDGQTDDAKVIPKCHLCLQQVTQKLNAKIQGDDLHTSITARWVPRLLSDGQKAKFRIGV